MLPNLEIRWIPDAKIRDFLLDGTSQKARSRLQFFRLYGFDRIRWRLLQAALHRHVETAEITLVRRDLYGATYAAFGPLETPSGRLAAVEAFWIVRTDDPRPQLTTAIPKGPWASASSAP